MLLLVAGCGAKKGTIGKDAAAGATDGGPPRPTGDGGSGAVLVADPAAFDFGLRTIGTTADLVVTIRNTGGAPSGTMTTSLATSGAYSITADSCNGVTLAEQASCAITIRLTPISAGSATTTLAVVGHSGGRATVKLTATTVAPSTLSITPTPFDFGSVDVGASSSARLFTVTNSAAQASGPLTSATTGSDRDQFVISNDLCGGMRLGPAQQCTLAVTFAPSGQSGPRLSSLTISGAPGGTAVAALMGATKQTYTLTITAANVDGASGTVTSTSMPDGDQIDCGTTCTVTREEGTRVVLTAAPAPGYYFGGWSGDCTGTATTCTLTLGQAHAAQATFTPANLVFITPNTYAVSEVQAANALSGTPTDAQKMLSGADEICRGLGQSNDFHAWIASSTENAASRLPPGARGWVRKDGRPFKDTLPGNATLYPVRFDQNGSLPTGTNTYFTGAVVAGDANATCGDWSGSGQVTLGKGDGVIVEWSDYNGEACTATTKEHLLCLQTKYTAVVSLSPPPANARFVFITKGTTTGSVGVAAFDALCTTEASAAHLPGAYKALVAVGGSSAASRFAPRAAPVAVYRPDGAIVADSDAILMSASGVTDAPIIITADGTPTFNDAWTGALDPASAPGLNCGDWQNAGANAWNGNPPIDGSWFFTGTIGCNFTTGLYCLQN